MERNKIKIILAGVIFMAIGASLMVIRSVPNYSDTVSKFFWHNTHSKFLTGLFGTNNPELSFEIGSYYFSARGYDLSKALSAYEEVLIFDYRFPRAHYQISRIHFLEGNFSAALVEVDKEISLYPKFEKSYYMKGLILGYSGDPAKAVENFKKFISLDSFNWAGWNDLSWVYFQIGDFNNAVSAAKEGLQRAENNPWLLNSLGVAFLNLGEKTMAQKSLSAALSRINEMSPEDWGRAYPGNNPVIYEEGLVKMKESIIFNLGLLN